MYIGGNYAKDAKQVYYGVGIITNADPMTFVYVGGSRQEGYGKDAAHVFNGKDIVANVDPAVCVPENLAGCKVK